MRKALWLPAIVVAVVPLAAEAQGTGTALAWGLMGGVNMAKVSGGGDADIEARVGFDLGLTAQKQMNATWSFNTGAHWTTKGYKLTVGGFSEMLNPRYPEVPVFSRSMKGSGEMQPSNVLGSGSAIEGTVSLTYLEVPVLFRRTKESGQMKPFVEFGTAVAFNTSCRLNVEVFGVGGGGDCDAGIGGIKKLDLGLVGGAGIEFVGMGRPWTLGVRYNKGVTKIADDDAAPRNSNLQFLLGFRFK